MTEQLVETDRISVNKINKKDAERIIVENHYTHAWTSCFEAHGIYYESDNAHDFFSTNESTLIGVAVYGNPVGKNASTSISPLLKHGETLELKRFWIADGYGKNVESYSLSLSIKLLKENNPHLKALLSYADPDAGHKGTIYQATNWIYQGTSEPGGAHAIQLEENGEWIHGRTIGDRYGTRAPVDLFYILGKKPFWIKKGYAKYRYLKIITGSKERKKIMNTLMYPQLPYPTGTEEAIGDIIYVDEAYCKSKSKEDLEL